MCKEDLGIEYVTYVTKRFKSRLKHFWQCREARNVQSKMAGTPAVGCTTRECA
jgi:hypothetical protein